MVQQIGAPNRLDEELRGRGRMTSTVLTQTTKRMELPSTEMRKTETEQS